MKKSFCFIFILLALFLDISCSMSSSGGGDAKTDLDWLCLFYMDADDEVLNDSIYRNMCELESVLAYMQNDDGSPKEEYPSVKFIVLWDGSNKQSPQIKYSWPDGALYELGPEPAYTYNPDDNSIYIDNDRFYIGRKTKDLTSTVSDWLPQEPDMASEELLTNFLKWSKKTYSAKNTILVFSDHGSGTYKETYTDTTKWPVKQSLCIDGSNTGSRAGAELSCKNITNALTAAGYTGSSKINLLVFDVCFQAGCEIVNCLSGYADYLLASPNLGYSHFFFLPFKNLKASYTARELGKNFVSEYYTIYASSAPACPVNEDSAHRASGYSLYTQTLFSLDPAKVSAMRSAVDDLASKINALDDTTKKYLFTEYLQQDYELYTACKGIAYQGSNDFLNDAGFFVKNILADSSLQSHTELINSALKLKEILKHGDDNLIVYAYAGKKGTGEHVGGKWDSQTSGQWYLTGARDFISGNTVPVENTDDIFGITIVTQDLWDSIDIVENYMEYTGFSSEWEKLIKYWDAEIKPKFKPLPG